MLCAVQAQLADELGIDCLMVFTAEEGPPVTLTQQQVQTQQQAWRRRASLLLALPLAPIAWNHAARGAAIMKPAVAVAVDVH